MPLTADNWPIAAAVLQYAAVSRRGVRYQDADSAEWVTVLQEVARAGFSDVDLTDCWVQVGDLSSDRIDQMAEAALEAQLTVRGISAIRRSVIDAQSGDANLAYSHRTIDAAAQLGAEVVSVGLHQPLTPAQREQLWFWTVEGHKDIEGDERAWNLAISRFRELGEHAAEVGVLLSLEMYEDTYLGTADSAVRMVQEVGLDNVGLNPDTGNLLRLHRPVESWVELLHKTLPFANYWHVKNYSRDENIARGFYSAVPAPLETGTISYREAVAIAIDAGFQGAFCVEHYGGDGLSVSARNERYLREQILPRHDDYPLGRSNVRQPEMTGDSR